MVPTMCHILSYNFTLLPYSMLMKCFWVRQYSLQLPKVRNWQIWKIYLLSICHFPFYFRIDSDTYSVKPHNNSQLANWSSGVTKASVPSYSHFYSRSLPLYHNVLSIFLFYKQKMKALYTSADYDCS